MTPIEHAREAYLRRYGGVRPEDVYAGKYDCSGFVKGYAAAIEDVEAVRDAR